MSEIYGSLSRYLVDYKDNAKINIPSLTEKIAQQLILNTASTIYFVVNIILNTFSNYSQLSVKNQEVKFSRTWTWIIVLRGSVFPLVCKIQFAATFSWANSLVTPR